MVQVEFSKIFIHFIDLTDLEFHFIIPSKKREPIYNLYITPLIFIHFYLENEHFLKFSFTL